MRSSRRDQRQAGVWVTHAACGEGSRPSLYRLRHSERRGLGVAMARGAAAPSSQLAAGEAVLTEEPELLGQPSDSDLSEGPGDSEFLHGPN